jgi:hypothetical protein
MYKSINLLCNRFSTSKTAYNIEDSTHTPDVKLHIILPRNPVVISMAEHNIEGGGGRGEFKVKDRDKEYKRWRNEIWTMICRVSIYV